MEIKCPKCGEIIHTKNIEIMFVICFTLIIFGILFWPTIYRYDKIKIDSSEYPVRINRLTGDAEVFFPHGWYKPGAE